MDLLQHSANPETLTREVAEMIAAGRTSVARPLLAAAHRMAPPSARLAELSARLALRENRPEDARAELDQAILIEPGHTGLRICRAQLRVDLGDLVGAAQDAAEAVVLDRADAAAKALLGMLMLELGHAEDARACLAEAVGAAPKNPSFREALAAAEEAGGDAQAAAATLAAGIALAPGCIELRSAAILLCVRRRDFTNAVRLAEEARMAGIANACVFGLKGHALSSLGRHEEAADAYREALKLGPSDPYVRHLVAASGFLPAAMRAPQEYVSTIFDGYAPRFEAHLIALGYRIPGVIRTALIEHIDRTGNRPIGPVLDLGCGTGLLGLVLADLPIGPLTGVDLSPRMLAQARSKGLYANLQQADLENFLAEDTTAWKLILAADVLCYFGELGNVLQAIFNRLAPGGLLLLSTEELLPDADGALPANLQGDGAWALGRQGRYAHTAEYLTKAAKSAGYTVLSLTGETQRFEADAPVPGFFAVLERPDHAG
jgi:predicted TPR repeat methyltransferase